MILISKEKFLEEHNKLSPSNLQATLALLNRFKEEKKPLMKDDGWCLDKHRIPFISWITAAQQKADKKNAERLGKKQNGRIKNVLMDQSIIAGVGNIYSDEALWRASLNPEERMRNIPDSYLKKLYASLKNVLNKGIDFGGDSMSDYRNIDGERGKFQEQHQAYRKTGTPCSLNIHGKKCKGIIQRKVVGGRSAHFCSVHQKLRSQLSNSL